MLCRSWPPIALLLFVVALCVPDTRAVELKGTFQLQPGDPVPQLVPVVDPKAAADYPGLQLFHENLLVDPPSRGIANIVVYVRGADVPITPAAPAALPPPNLIEVKNGQFVPRLSGLWVGKQGLFVRNMDQVMVNPNFPLTGAAPLLHAFQPGVATQITVAESKLLPQQITCNIHSWTKGYVLVRPNPYFAVSDADGSFELKNLPAGIPLEIQVWHERAGYLEALPQWTKGRFTVNLAKDLDLGIVPVPRALLR